MRGRTLAELKRPLLANLTHFQGNYEHTQALRDMAWEARHAAGADSSNRLSKACIL